MIGLKLTTYSVKLLQQLSVDIQKVRLQPTHKFSANTL